MIKMQYGVGMQIIASVFFTNQIADDHYFIIYSFPKILSNGRLNKWIDILKKIIYKLSDKGRVKSGNLQDLLSSITICY